MNHPFETFLVKSDKVLGPGHNSEVVEDDNGRTWLLYHGFQANDPDAGRVLYLDELKWDREGWPYIESGKPSEEAEKPYFKDYHNVTGIVEVNNQDDDYSIAKGTGNYYQINGPAKESFEWSICAANGTLVRSGKACQTKELWINDLQAGVYVIQVKGSLGGLNCKIIKQS